MQENYKPNTISDKKKLSQAQILLIAGGGLALFAILVGNWFWYQASLVTTPTLVMEPELQTDDVALTYTNTIYFTGIPLDRPEDNVSYIHELDVATKEAQMFFDFPAYGMYQTDEFHALGLFHYLPELPGNVIRLSILNLPAGESGEFEGFFEVPGIDQTHNIIEVIADNTSGFYAYTYFVGEPADDDLLDLATYNIALRNDTNEDTESVNIIIEGAANPAFIENGEALLYARADGLYHYDIASKIETYAVQSAEFELRIADDFVAPANGDEIIMTIFPNAEFVKFTKLTDRATPGYQGVDTIYGTEGFAYSSLVLHPDETMFAAIKQFVTSDITEEPNYFEIEIRSVDDGALVDTIRVDGFEAITAALAQWK